MHQKKNGRLLFCSKRLTEKMPTFVSFFSFSFFFHFFFFSFLFFLYFFFFFFEDVFWGAVSVLQTKTGRHFISFKTFTEKMPTSFRYMCVCVCVCACVRACVRACVCVCCEDACLVEFLYRGLTC